MAVNQAYCGDHFTVYKNIESLCWTFETNIILHVNIYLIINMYTQNNDNREKRKG